MPPATRRELRRAETIAEMKSIARATLAEEGVEAVSLRAIARELGMASGNAYSYFATREALLAALAVDIRGELARTLEQARAAANTPAGQVISHGRAYREWALKHPHEFRLVFSRAGQHTTDQADYELCLGIVGLAAQSAQSGPVRDYTWADMNESFVAIARDRFPGLTPATLALGLRIWGRMHGLVTLEIDGVLGPQIADPAALYDDELESLATALDPR
ncbi:WHG domain-containing protein [Nocardia huaxiensis]|uniref:WHG domain-containing protein n=2 Tax=Nocardia huaxiensis TaxID=2755382 RepID=A0A7D6ZR65_9NOCA|nr:WHG domain-containing protein [Nocardia huaxiensis]QLY31725.1 WHG domain-containing protein [Nocardia huaxiensis]